MACFPLYEINQALNLIELRESELYETIYTIKNTVYEKDTLRSYNRRRDGCL